MIRRFIRKLTGCSLREDEANNIMASYEHDMVPELRQHKTRVAAVERLVLQLQKDTMAWQSRSD